MEQDERLVHPSAHRCSHPSAAIGSYALSAFVRRLWVTHACDRSISKAVGMIFRTTPSRVRQKQFHPCLRAEAGSLLLVDFGRLDEGFDVMVFVGSSQKWLPIEVVASARTLGHRVQWHRVDGNGSNALDFHIACQLGRVLEKTPCIHCIVLSKDKGFDPLLRHQNRSGLKCGRMNSLLELDPKGALTEEPNDKRVLELLRKTEKKSCSRKGDHGAWGGSHHRNPLREKGDFGKQENNHV